MPITKPSERLQPRGAPLNVAAGSAKRRRRLVLLGAAIALLVGLMVLAYKPLSLYWRIAHPTQQDLPLPAELWAMDGERGRALTERNRGDVDFQPTKSAFQSQIYGSYCGVASAVIALRSLGRDQTEQPASTQTSLTQQTFFTPKASRVRSERDVFYGGMSLDELGGLLRAHGADTQVVHAADSDVDRFRQEARANVEQGPHDRLLVNYLRKAIGQRTGGHISPVAAYDAETDRFLVLDVSTYKYPPVWVETAALYKAMNTVDAGAKRTRGWVHVRLTRAHVRAPAAE